MNKDLIIKNATEKFTGELLDIVLKQIDDYFELKDSKYQIKHNYKINDKVILNKNNLLHGIGKHNDLIKMFAERGVTSPDFFDTGIDHAFCYTAAFWNVSGEITLQEYIENYSGIVAKVNDEYWQVPYKHLDEFVEILKDIEHWKWSAESSMEIRFMPSLAKNNNQIAFIKPANYEISKTRKYKNDISRIDNMDYDSESDLFICQNGKKLISNGVKIRKSKTGYESIKTIYICEDCSNCNYKSQCIKGNNSKIPLEKRTKKIETSKKFNRQRKEDLERIITSEGILLRMNRSIQAEGSFAQLKHDMNFRRFMCRGQKNVLAESILLAVAQNINKLHNKIQTNRTGKHLFELNKTA